MIQKTIFIVALCLLPLTTQAQQIPSFAIVDLGPLNLDGNVEKRVDPTTAFSNVKNEEMKSVLELQNQITMLNALTNWQEQISQLQTTYTTAGMPFYAPKPPREICEQVPANAVCGEAYADLAPVEMATAAPLSVSSKTVKTSKKSSEPAAEPISSYEWASVSCNGSDCKAVLVDLASGARMTALQGEMIDDKVMVQNISSNGVTLTINGKAEQLKPARPTKTAANQSSDSNASLSQSLEGIDTSGAITAPSEPIVLDDGTGASGAAASGGGVGNTGLF